MPRGRIRTLPDALPRPCAYCSKVFTPVRKEARAKFCCISCCGKAFCNPEHNRRVGREFAGVIREKNLNKGEGKTYRKFHGRHEHRVVMEQKLGRPLQTGEIVHHKDGNKRNNHPDNLELLSSQAEHARIHSTKNRRCTVQGCERKHNAHGYCLNHWRKIKRANKLGDSARRITGFTINRELEN